MVTIFAVNREPTRLIETWIRLYIYICVRYIYTYPVSVASSWKMKMKRNVSSDRDSIIRGNDIQS